MVLPMAPKGLNEAQTMKFAFKSQILDFSKLKEFADNKKKV